MSPTILPSGEIVAIDKISLRFGLQGGPNGESRAEKNKKRQQEYEQAYPDEWHEPRISVTDLGPVSWRNILRQSFSPISVGDVVVVQHPSRKGTVCKRVLGLPGDQILQRGIFVVPDGHLWLEGDNPLNSADSRTYGPVPAALLVGRVLCRIWPLRGNAFLARGVRPQVHQQQPYAHYAGSTVLPAGYAGQHIVKILNEEPR